MMTGGRWQAPRDDGVRERMTGVGHLLKGERFHVTRALVGRPAAWTRTIAHSATSPPPCPGFTARRTGGAAGSPTVSTTDARTPSRGSTLVCQARSISLIPDLAQSWIWNWCYHGPVCVRTHSVSEWGDSEDDDTQPNDMVQDQECSQPVQWRSTRAPWIPTRLSSPGRDELLVRRISASRQLHSRPGLRDAARMSNQVYLIPTKDDSADQTYSKHY
jgi:hypothetical protein